MFVSLLKCESCEADVTYRVEGQEPKFPNDSVPVPEGRRRRIGFSRQDNSYDSHEKVETNTSTGSRSRSVDAVRKTDAEDLATEEANVVDDKCG
jgi:hypothetical protein